MTAMQAKSMRWGGLAAATIGACALLSGCWDTTSVASSEIGNPPAKTTTVKGIVYSGDGSPAINTRIGLYPAGYNPVTDSGKTSARIYFDTTDAAGTYTLPRVDSGVYNLEAVQLTERTRSLIREFRVHADTIGPVMGPLLQAPGSVTLILPDSLEAAGAYVYVEGTEHVQPLAFLRPETRLLRIDSLPPGPSPAIYYYKPGSAAVQLSGGTRVISEDTVPASAFQEWNYSKRIFINTAAAGVTAQLRDFPLLVNLNSGNFEFSQASGDGHEVRFAKKDGTPLPYEIETWNKAAAMAAIWVKLDTVIGNDSTQFIRLYWGNAGAPAASGNPVFDSTDGFVSVWHMQILTAGASPNFADASNYGNPLLALGGVAATDLEASPLGLGLHLDGGPRMLETARSFVNPSVFTVSLWFKTTSDSGGKLIGFGADPGIKDTSRDRHIWLDTLGKIHFGIFPNSAVKGSQPDVLSGPKAMNDGQWHLVAGSMSSAGMALFIDGVKVDSNAVNKAQNYTGYWRMGFDFKFYDWPFAPSTNYFKGSIDEARVSQRAYSSGWEKLSYENQRTGGALLRFE